MNQIDDGKMKTQPARPPSGRIAHLFSSAVNQIHDGNSMPRVALHLYGVIHVKVLRT
ncbi:MAG: hypothetical protein LBL62_10995 [Planctomycetaceae bacterium]|nr:hypothetical protein [Planctomycetaceae bacterium]